MKIKMTLAAKMICYFLLVIFVALIGFSYAIVSINGMIQENNDLQAVELPRLEMTEQINYNSMAEIANLRGYVAYGKEEFIDNYKRYSDINKKLEQELINDSRDEEGRRLSSEVKTLEDKYCDIAENKFIQLKKQGKDEEASQVLENELVPTGKELTAKMDEYKKYRSNKLTSVITKIKEDSDKIKIGAIITSILVAALGIAIGLFAARKISKPVKELQEVMAEVSEGNLLTRSSVKTTDEIGQLSQFFNSMIDSQQQIIRAIRNSSVELAAASEEMAASSAEVASSNTSIAENIQQVVQSMNEGAELNTETAQVLIELSSLIQIAKLKAKSASTNSSVTIDAANDGKKTVTEAMRSMDTIYTKTLETEKAITLLNDYSQQIGMINETITSIANQTNLLALNAAIEAARAGETGKGFAVVADEVRKLAEQSNLEAANISQIISKVTENTRSAVIAMKQSLTEVETGVEAVNEADKALENILEAVSNTVSDVNEISKVTDDEVASSDKIVQLIHNVAKDFNNTLVSAQEVSSAVEETTAASENVASSSEETSAMAQSLQNVVERFKV